MAISHADHDHPNTPAARAKCRRAMDNTHTPYVNPMRELAEQAGVVKPAKVTVVPRKRGDGGVVKGMQAAAPRRLKVSGTLIKAIGDLADVPAALAVHVRRAWALDWTVQVGHPFNDDERRIVITGPKAEIALVWDSRGRTATFVRHLDSSVTSKLATDDAFDAADTDDAWDGHGNYVGL